MEPKENLKEILKRFSQEEGVSIYGSDNNIGGSFVTLINDDNKAENLEARMYEELESEFEGKDINVMSYQIDDYYMFEADVCKNLI